MRGQRWRPVHTQSIAVHTGPLPWAGSRWAAVFEAGPRGCLDGASALLAGGLEHFTEDVIRVSVPRGVLVRRAPGVDIRQTRRLVPDDLAPTGVPRTRPEVAGIRAALWAASDKQATLLLTMAVQQGLTTPERLGGQALTVPPRPAADADHRGDRRPAGRRAVAGRARVRPRCVAARGSRARPPGRCAGAAAGAGTSMCAGRRAAWWWRSTASSTSGPSTSSPDALRHNEVSLGSSTVLRLPLLGLRVAADEFFDQVERGLAAGGWCRAA